MLWNGDSKVLRFNFPGALTYCFVYMDIVICDSRRREFFHSFTVVTRKCYHIRFDYTPQATRWIATTAAILSEGMEYPAHRPTNLHTTRGKRRVANAERNVRAVYIIITITQSTHMNTLTNKVITAITLAFSTVTKTRQRGRDGPRSSAAHRRARQLPSRS
jgi:hypothetical protein